MRRELSLLAVGVGLLAGCSEDTRHVPLAATAAPVSSGASPVHAPLPPAPPLMGPAFRLQVATAFAPQLRFNAHHPGSSAPQNRHEDLFPMGVASFLEELHSGRARVLRQGSTAAGPGVSEVRPIVGAVAFEADRIAGVPREMVGDPPGQAPLYVNVYEDPAARVLDAQGRGAITVTVEYWIFYPQDRADVHVLGYPTGLLQDPFGHIGDWESVGLRARLQLGEDSRLLGGDIEEAYFASHGDTYVVVDPELERVDDAGQDDPAGTHMVVYVSQGKHGSYPQAGTRRELPLPPQIAQFVDVFHGNGVWVDAWQGDLFDLEDVASNPDEFSPPELAALLAASPAAPAIQDWTEFAGRWGPTRNRIRLAGHTIALASSPAGPKQKTDYGAFAQSATPWVLAKTGGAAVFTIDRDAGIVVPRASPIPTPIRR